MRHEAHIIGPATEPALRPQAPPAALSPPPLCTALQHIAAHLGVSQAGTRPKPASGPEPARAAARAPIARDAAARQCGLSLRKVLLRDDWWAQQNGPLLAYRGADTRPVALIPAGTGYRVFEAGVIGRNLSAEEAAQMSPTAFMPYKAPPYTARTYRQLAVLALRGLGPDLSFVALMSLALAGLGVAVPLLAVHLTGFAIPAGDLPRLAYVALALTMIAVGGGVFGFVQRLALLRIETRLDLSLQSMLFQRFLQLPLGLFRGLSSGDLAGRLLGLQSVRGTLTALALRGTQHGALCLASAGVMLWLNGPVALVLLAGVTCGALLVGAMRVGQHRHSSETMLLQGTLNALTLQALGAVGKFRVAAAESRFLARWAQLLGVLSAHEGQVTRRRIAVEALESAAPIALIALYVFVAARDGAWFVQMSPSTVLAFNIAFGQLLFSACGLVRAVSRLAEIAPLLDRARPILEAPADHPGVAQDTLDLAGRISVRDLCFAYDPAMPRALDQVSLDIAEGEFVAVVGASGSGKSTLVRLLLGLERPQSGQVLFDGRPLEGLDLPDLRSKIGVVLQDAKPIPGTIASNIIGSSGAKPEDARRAAQQVGLQQDIDAMPMGLHTVLVEGAKAFSGGQIQRMMIARALVRKPKVLILDEATSALDNHSQQAVVETLSALRATRVVIAHRLSTIRQADRILVLDKGQLVQSGRYQDLVAQPGPFRDLARRQLPAGPGQLDDRKT